MTNPDPSSPLEDDALDFLAENLEPEGKTSVDFTEASSYSAPDEDRLYTDNIIRQNEAASRFLLLSVLGAGVICIGVGIWYFIVRNQAQPQQTAPLQVPEQPSFAPLPSSNPNGAALPTLPLPGRVSPGQTLPPTDSGISPGNSVEPSTVQSPKTNSPNISPTPPPPPGPAAR
jgi:hypothetical protein